MMHVRMRDFKLIHKRTITILGGLRLEGGGEGKEKEKRDVISVTHSVATWGCTISCNSYNHDLVDKVGLCLCLTLD